MKTALTLTGIYRFAFYVKHLSLKVSLLTSCNIKLWHKLALLATLGVFTLVIGCPTCYDMPLKQFVVSLLFSITMCGALWLGNDLLTDYLEIHFPWFKNPLKRLSISLVATTLVSLVIVIAVNLIFLSIWGFPRQQLKTYNWVATLLFPLLLTFFISLFMHSRSFLLGWRQTAIDAERLKGENITSQYETLKSQVNPHFLFNSLNALTSLVHDQPDLAVKFIKQLSEVYRYVLDSQHKEVVPLAMELKFVESYVFLQKIRFGDDLQVLVEVPGTANLLIAPLSLQMLIENAVKHNIILEEAPLRIRIFLDDHQYIVVCNNLQEKKTGLTSPELGLKNIKARYEYLTDRPVYILREKQTFTVKLPVLDLQQA
jgi:sensor histidine kinase YesM